MKDNFIVYFDEDGVVNLFEKDKEARKNATDKWRMLCYYFNKSN